MAPGPQKVGASVFEPSMNTGGTSSLAGDFNAPSRTAQPAAHPGSGSVCPWHAHPARDSRAGRPCQVLKLRHYPQLETVLNSRNPLFEILAAYQVL
jgi:hypothetical protein